MTPAQHLAEAQALLARVRNDHQPERRTAEAMAANAHAAIALAMQAGLLRCARCATAAEPIGPPGDDELGRRQAGLLIMQGELICVYHAEQ